MLGIPAQVVGGVKGQERLRGPAIHRVSLDRSHAEDLEIERSHPIRYYVVLNLALGFTLIRRDLGERTMHDVSRLIKESIRYALAHRADALSYALQYARDMTRELADQFVGMYVNDWTLDFGPTGREAVRQLLARGHAAGVIPREVAPEFVDEGVADGL